ncbi:hypothetical protein WJX72_004063 [[Myrmecia] bisecta]|uniref:Vacuolar protein sorting-associated protein 13 DH-like domain-containing protein n=1 Tax=[Myrmecia] bisecta TaxID=41462 RepID=A0AAW1R5R6_9CHLO
MSAVTLAIEQTSAWGENVALDAAGFPLEPPLETKMVSLSLQTLGVSFLYAQSCTRAPGHIWMLRSASGTSRSAPAPSLQPAAVFRCTLNISNKQTGPGSSAGSADVVLEAEALQLRLFGLCVEEAAVIARHVQLVSLPASRPTDAVMRPPAGPSTQLGIRAMVKGLQLELSESRLPMIHASGTATGPAAHASPARLVAQVEDVVLILDDALAGAGSRGWLGDGVAQAQLVDLSLVAAAVSLWGAGLPHAGLPVMILDDLRCGLFSVSAAVASRPGPMEISLGDKGPGFMSWSGSGESWICWRYAHPRALTSLLVAGVPCMLEHAEFEISYFDHDLDDYAVLPCRCQVWAGDGCQDMAAAGHMDGHEGSELVDLLLIPQVHLADEWQLCWDCPADLKHCNAAYLFKRLLVNPTFPDPPSEAAASPAADTGSLSGPDHGHSQRLGARQDVLPVPLTLALQAHTLRVAFLLEQPSSDMPSAGNVSGRLDEVAAAHLQDFQGSLHKWPDAVSVAFLSHLRVSYNDSSALTEETLLDSFRLSCRVDSCKPALSTVPPVARPLHAAHSGPMPTANSSAEGGSQMAEQLPLHLPTGQHLTMPRPRPQQPGLSVGLRVGEGPLVVRLRVAPLDMELQQSRSELMIELPAHQGCEFGASSGPSQDLFALRSRPATAAQGQPGTMCQLQLWMGGGDGWSVPLPLDESSPQVQPLRAAGLGDGAPLSPTSRRASTLGTIYCGVTVPDGGTGQVAITFWPPFFLHNTLPLAVECCVSRAAPAGNDIDEQAAGVQHNIGGSTDVICSPSVPPHGEIGLVAAKESSERVSLRMASTLIDIFNPTGRQRLYLAAPDGATTMITYRVLFSRGHLHLVLFHDHQPPCIVRNATARPLLVGYFPPVVNKLGEVQYEAPAVAVRVEPEAELECDLQPPERPCGGEAGRPVGSGQEGGAEDVTWDVREDEEAFLETITNPPPDEPPAAMIKFCAPGSHDWSQPCALTPGTCTAGGCTISISRSCASWRICIQPDQPKTSTQPSPAQQALEAIRPLALSIHCASLQLSVWDDERRRFLGPAPPSTAALIAGSPAARELFCVTLDSLCMDVARYCHLGAADVAGVAWHAPPAVLAAGKGAAAERQPEARAQGGLEALDSSRVVMLLRVAAEALQWDSFLDSSSYPVVCTTLASSSAAAAVSGARGKQVAALILHAEVHHGVATFPLPPIPLQGPQKLDAAGLAAVKLDAAALLDSELFSEATAASASRLLVENLHIGRIHVLFDIHVSDGSAHIPIALDTHRSPLYLPTVVGQGLLFRPSVLLHGLLAHYMAEALLNAPQMLGSLELLFNPTGLIQSVTQGFQDLVALPLAAIEARSPSQFITGVGLGSASLLRHLSGWTLTSISGFSSAFSRVLERTLVSRSAVRGGLPPSHANPQALSAGLASGLYGLYGGVTAGVTGIVRAPMDGYSDGSGVLLGLGRGLLGAVGLPLSGALDLVSAVSSGLASSTGVSHRTHPRRPGRVTADGEVRSSRARFLKHLQPLDAPDALDQLVASRRQYVAHCEAASLTVFRGVSGPQSRGYAESYAIRRPCLLLTHDALIVLSDGGLFAAVELPLQGAKIHEEFGAHRLSVYSAVASCIGRAELVPQGVQLHIRLGLPEWLHLLPQLRHRAQAAPEKSTS